MLQMGLLRITLRQTRDMLPRRFSRNAVCLIVSFGLGAALFAGAPAQGATKYTPPVSVVELDIAPEPTIGALTAGKRLTVLLSAQSVKPFTLVGLTGWER